MSADSLTHDARASTEPAASAWAARFASVWSLGLAGCLIVATLLRTWGAWSNNGFGNSYYTATALSMSQDWVAFLTGGLDTEQFLTMDKPAVWLWPSALLIKWFGLNWATLFLPTVLAGVASVLVLALAVREALGDSPVARATGLLAALGLAISPINVAIDRNNSPDALMLLALLLAAWMTLRAVRRGRLLPLVGAGALIGLAFNTKYFEAYLVIPTLALVWLICGVGSVGRRVAGIAWAGLSTLVVSAAWPVLVSLAPLAERPWFGSSVDGSVLGRLIAVVVIHLGLIPLDLPDDARAFVDPFLTGEAFHSGTAGPGRLLSGVLADQVSWWLPLAVLAAVTLAVGLRGRNRHDPAVAGLVLWASWAATCWTVFSFMGGALHPYYTNMLAPALAVLAAGGLVTAWTMWRRGQRFGTIMLAAQVLVVAGWSAYVLVQTSGQRPDWLTPLITVAGVLALIVILLARGRRGPVAAVAVLTAVATLAGPLTWSIKTTDQQLLGVNPLANQPGRYTLTALPSDFADGFVAMALAAEEIDYELVAYLKEHQGDARWMVATLNAMQGAPLIIGSGGRPVMAVGGFQGTDPIPTLEELQSYVGTGELRFFLVNPQGGSADLVAAPSWSLTQWAWRVCTPVDITGAAEPVDDPDEPPQVGPELVLLDCQGAR